MAPAEFLVTGLHRADTASSTNSRHTNGPEPVVGNGEISPRSGHGRHQAKGENLMSKLLGEKEQEWHALTSKEGPLRLLDLPVDVLNLIIKEVISFTSLHWTACTDITPRSRIQTTLSLSL